MDNHYWVRDLEELEQVFNNSIQFDRIEHIQCSDGVMKSLQELADEYTSQDSCDGGLQYQYWTKDPGWRVHVFVAKEHR